MRKIGESAVLTEAQTFLAYLRSIGIEGEIRDVDSPPCTVWVYDEDRLTQASEEFKKFIANPKSEDYAPDRLKSFMKSPEATDGLGLGARTSRPPAPFASRKSATRSAQVGSLGTNIPVTWGVIIVCVTLRLIAQAPLFKPYLDTYLRFGAEIFDGQIWRLITPIFLHGGLIHLAFNMFWLWDVGGNIEREEGRRYVLLMIVVTGAICNTMQYLVSGPYFEGMSGVVYAMIGFAWMMTRYHFRSSYNLSDGMMLFMVIWIFVGLVFVELRIANTQHITGMVMGLLLGGFRSGFFKDQLRRRRRKR